MKQEIKIHERLAAWKAFRDCSLQVMADACGMSRQALSLIVLGETDPRYGTVHAIIVKAFRTDEPTFFGPLPKRAAA